MRREHRQNKEQRRLNQAIRRRVYRRRRVSVALLLLLILLAALSFFMPQSHGQVATIEAPSSGDGLLLPGTSQASQADKGEHLQSQLELLVASSPGRDGVEVYDPSSEQGVEINGRKPFAAASLGKLPVLLTLYQEAANDDIDLDERISIQPTDVQSYGTGVLQDYPVGYTMTLRECARTMIKESDNTAWVMLERRLGRERISAELSTLGADDTDYASLKTTPADVLLMLRAISDPSYTTPDLSDEMLDDMTNTAFEERIPASLPKKARVAHKIGTVDDTFSDAGLVYRSSKDHEGYFIVIMTSGSSDEKEALKTIRDISRATYDGL